MTDRRCTVRQPRAKGLEADLDAVRALGQIVRRIAEVENPLATGFEPLAGIAQAEARLDQFEVDRSPPGKGIAVRDDACPVTVARFIARLDLHERAKSEERSILRHAEVQIADDSADLEEVACDRQGGLRAHLAASPQSAGT